MPMKRLLFTILSVFSVAFCAKAQDCDAFTIEEIFIHPTQPDILMIRTDATAEAAFNYPGFRVHHNGELLAEGETVYFQLSGDQFHALQLETPVIEDEEYTLDIELYTVFFGSLSCEIEWTGVPYDASQCFEGNLWLNLGGTTAEDINLTIFNDQGDIVIQTLIELDMNQSQWAEPLCLMRDCHLIQAAPAEGTFAEDVFISYQTEGYTWYNQLMDAGTDSFTGTLEIWQGCSISGLPSNGIRPPKIYPNPVKVGEPFTIEGNARVEQIEVRSISGSLERIWSPGQTDQFKLQHAGMYFIVTRFTNGSQHTQRMVVH